MKKTLLNLVSLNPFKPNRLAFMAGGEGGFTPEKADMQEVVDNFKKDALDKGADASEQDIEAKYQEAKTKLDEKAEELLHSDDAASLENFSEFQTFIDGQMKALESVKTNYLATRKAEQARLEKAKKEATEETADKLKETVGDAQADSDSFDDVMSALNGDSGSKKAASIDIGGATEVGTKAEVGAKAEVGTPIQLEAMLAERDVLNKGTTEHVSSVGEGAKVTLNDLKKLGEQVKDSFNNSAAYKAFNGALNNYSTLIENARTSQNEKIVQQNKDAVKKAFEDLKTQAANFIDSTKSTAGSLSESAKNFLGQAAAIAKAEVGTPEEFDKMLAERDLYTGTSEYTSDVPKSAASEANINLDLKAALYGLKGFAGKAQEAFKNNGAYEAFTNALNAYNSFIERGQNFKNEQDREAFKKTWENLKTTANAFVESVKGKTNSLNTYAKQFVEQAMKVANFNSKEPVKPTEVQPIDLEATLKGLKDLGEKAKDAFKESGAYKAFADALDTYNTLLERGQKLQNEQDKAKLLQAWENVKTTATNFVESVKKKAGSLNEEAKKFLEQAARVAQVNAAEQSGRPFGPLTQEQAEKAEVSAMRELSWETEASEPSVMDKHYKAMDEAVRNYEESMKQNVTTTTDLIQALYEDAKALVNAEAQFAYKDAPEGAIGSMKVLVNQRLKRLEATRDKYLAKHTVTGKEAPKKGVYKKPENTNKIRKEVSSYSEKDARYNKYFSLESYVPTAHVHSEYTGLSSNNGEEKVPVTWRITFANAAAEKNIRLADLPKSLTQDSFSNGLRVTSPDGTSVDAHFNGKDFVDKDGKHVVIKSGYEFSKIEKPLVERVKIATEKNADRKPAEAPAETAKVEPKPVEPAPASATEKPVDAETTGGAAAAAILDALDGTDDKKTE